MWRQGWFFRRCEFRAEFRFRERLAHRKENLESAALAHTAADAYLAAVALRDPLADRQPQSDPPSSCSVERLKYPLKVLLRDAMSCVLDAQGCGLHLAGSGQQIPRMRTDSDNPPHWHGLGGVQ
jgi:hypothetical protein